VAGAGPHDLTGARLAVLRARFVAAGVAIGCVETSEHAAIATAAPTRLRGSAFGLLAVIQSVGNLAASGIAGLWTRRRRGARPATWPAGWVLARVGLAGAGREPTLHVGRV
jgi:hypothetical protein